MISNACTIGMPAVEHRGELAGEDRDVLGRDLAFALEELACLADPGRGDALAAQVGAQLQLRSCARPRPLTRLPLLVLAFPEERELSCLMTCDVAMSLDFAMPRQCLLAQSTVTRLISSRLVSPSWTFLRPDAAQVPDALALRPARLMSHHVAAFHDDAADLLGDRHHLVDADPALVAVRAVAGNPRAVNRGCRSRSRPA